MKTVEAILPKKYNPEVRSNEGFIAHLKGVVQTHDWTETEFIKKCDEKTLSLRDLRSFVSQEWHVSKEFPNWMRELLAKIPKKQDRLAKAYVSENIASELGLDEGNSHFGLLQKAALELGLENPTVNPTTQEYLATMRNLCGGSFLMGLGALGPANEYLINIEYSKIRRAVKGNFPFLKEFFRENLDADEVHSEKFFWIICENAKNPIARQTVINGMIDSLDARRQFYEGLKI